MELNRIYNEDCLEGMKRIPDKSVNMILCDLPYGTTANSWDTIIPLEPLWKEYKRVIKDGGAVVLTADQPFATKVINSNLSWFRYEWIYAKPNATGFMNAKRMPMKIHENILVFYEKLPNYNPQFGYGIPYKAKSGKRGTNYNEHKTVETKSDGKRYPTTIIKPFDVATNKGLHPTQKPVSLFEYLIKTYTSKGDKVLDNCMGSGTTAIACLNTDRKFIGFELKKEYFDIAQKRIKNHHIQVELDLFSEV